MTDVVNEGHWPPEVRLTDRNPVNKTAAADAMPTAPTQRRSWVRPAIAGSAAFALIAAVFAAGHWYEHGRFIQSTNDAYLEADNMTVATKVAGTVQKIFVVDNQLVHAGDPLVALDSDANDAKVAEAEATAAQGRAQAAVYASQIHEQEAAIAQSSAALEQAQVQRRYAQSEVERYQPLAASGAESQTRLVSLMSNRDQAAAQVLQASAALRQARVRLVSLRSQVDVAEAQVRSAQAQAHQAQIDVNSALIRASIDGRVGDRSVRLGQQAQVGTPLMTIVPDKHLYIVANFKETQVGLMRAGQPVRIQVDALSGETLSGTVESFAPGTGAEFALIPPSNATGNFTKIVQRIPVRIRLDKGELANHPLVAGMSVTASVDTVDGKATSKQNDEPATQTTGAQG
jgi:membrane fusion protein (multidrug efflux system)